MTVRTGDYYQISGLDIIYFFCAWDPLSLSEAHDPFYPHIVIRTPMK